MYTYIVEYNLMQKVGTLLGRVNKNISKIIKLRDLWPEIAGEVLAAHTEPVNLKGKTLHVLCDSPAWVQQMGILSDTLIPRIKKLGKITVDQVDGRFGMPYKLESRPKPIRSPINADIDPAAVARIKDDKVKQILFDLLDKKGG